MPLNNRHLHNNMSGCQEKSILSSRKALLKVGLSPALSFNISPGGSEVNYTSCFKPTPIRRARVVCYFLKQKMKCLTGSCCYIKQYQSNWLPLRSNQVTDLMLDDWKWSSSLNRNFSKVCVCVLFLSSWFADKGLHCNIK